MYGVKPAGGIRMTIARQDAWSHDEDLLLAEVVLRHIREGSTQLKAFEDVGSRLSRTAAACGFRWNSFVRKQYDTGIELAKKQRKETKAFSVEKEVFSENISEPSSDRLKRKENEDADITMKEVIRFLTKTSMKLENFRKEKQQLLSLVETMTSDHQILVVENEQLKKKLSAIDEDYRALLKIMERARKLIVLEDQNQSESVKFQMDQNGNLERVKK
jgi:prespore-specific regulator